MKRRVLLTAAFLITAGSVFGLTIGDVALSVPVAAKTVAPLVLIPEMLSDPKSLPLGLTAVALYTVPNTMLLINMYSGNPEGTALWRKITTFADGAMTLGFLGIGAYSLIAETDLGGWGAIVAAIYFAFAVPAGLAFGLDFIPYSIEG